MLKKLKLIFFSFPFRIHFQKSRTDAEIFVKDAVFHLKYDDFVDAIGKFSWCLLLMNTFYLKKIFNYCISKKLFFSQHYKVCWRKKNDVFLQKEVLSSFFSATNTLTINILRDIFHKFIWFYISGESREEEMINIPIQIGEKTRNNRIFYQTFGRMSKNKIWKIVDSLAKWISCLKMVLWIQ